MVIPVSAYKKWHYSLSALRIGYDIYRQTNVMPLNPYDIHGTSLLDVDVNWWNDFNDYLFLMRYFKDELKRDPRWK